MIEEWTDRYDRLLARSVFATDRADEAERMILAWARTRGFGDGQVSAVEISVGAAVTLQLARDKVFVKVWSGEADPKALSAQLQVQAGLAASGFPAPRVLTEFSPLGPGWAAAMEYKRDGVATDVRVPGVRRAMAAGLLQFVRLSESCRDMEGLPQRLLPEGIWPVLIMSCLTSRRPHKARNGPTTSRAPPSRSCDQRQAALSSVILTGARRTCGWDLKASRSCMTGMPYFSTARPSLSELPPRTSQ